MHTELRVFCSVPGCKRSRARRGRASKYEEFLCADHWRLVPKRMRRVLFRIHRKLNSMVMSENDGELIRIFTREYRIWRRIKREAIEVAMGISA